MVFDLVDPELRNKPAAIRVVEGVEAVEPRTVLEIPPQTYPSGVVNAEVNFATPGRHTAIVTLEEPSDPITFPIRVAMWSTSFVSLVGFLVVGSALGSFLMGRKKE